MALKLAPMEGNGGGGSLLMEAAGKTAVEQSVLQHDASSLINVHLGGGHLRGLRLNANTANIKQAQIAGRGSGREEVGVRPGWHYSRGRCGGLLLFLCHG